MHNKLNKTLLCCKIESGQIFAWRSSIKFITPSNRAQLILLIARVGATGLQLVVAV